MTERQQRQDKRKNALGIVVPIKKINTTDSVTPQVNDGPTKRASKHRLDVKKEVVDKKTNIEAAATTTTTITTNYDEQTEILRKMNKQLDMIILKLKESLNNGSLPIVVQPTPIIPTPQNTALTNSVIPTIRSRGVKLEWPLCKECEHEY